MVEWIPTDDEPDLRDFAWRFQWDRLHFAAEQTVRGVNAVSVSPDGNLIVADEVGIREWNPHTQSLLNRWEGNASYGGEQVALSPCGRWATVSIDGEQKVRLIEIATGETIRRVTGTHARFAIGGDYVLVWNNDDESRQSVGYQIWDVEAGTHTSHQHIRHEFESAGSLAADGQSFALKRNESQLDVYFGNQVRPSVWVYNKEVESSTWSRSGNLFASGHFSGEIRLRFVDRPQGILTLKNTGQHVTALGFSPDGRQLAAGSMDGRLDLYDVSRFAELAEKTSIENMSPPKPIKSLNAHVGGIKTVVFSKDNTMLATHSVTGTAKLWSLKQRVAWFSPTKQDEFALDGRVPVEIIDEDHGVEVIRVLDARESVSNAIQPGDRITTITVDKGVIEIDSQVDANDVERLLVGAPDSLVKLHLTSAESTEPKLVELRRIRQSEPPGFLDLTFTPDGRSIAIASRRGSFSRSLKHETIRQYGTMSHGVAVSPDGQLLAMDDITELVLWDLQADRPLERLPARVSAFPSAYDKGSGGSLVFSPDGRYLAIGTGFRFGAHGVRSDLKVWEVATRKEIGAPLFKNETGLTGVSFTRGQCVAGCDGSARNNSNLEYIDMEHRRFTRGFGSRIGCGRFTEWHVACARWLEWDRDLGSLVSQEAPCDSRTSGN